MPGNELGGERYFPQEHKCQLPVMHWKLFFRISPCFFQQCTICQGQRVEVTLYCNLCGSVFQRKFQMYLISRGGGGEVVGERERNKACLWFGMEERKEKTDQLRTSFLSITQSNGLNEHTWVTSSRPFNINDTSLQWERRRQSVTTDYQCNKVQLCWLYAWKVER